MRNAFFLVLKKSDKAKITDFEEANFLESSLKGPHQVFGLLPPRHSPMSNLNGEGKFPYGWKTAWRKEMTESYARKKSEHTGADLHQ